MFKLKFIWSKLKGKRTLFVLGMILTIITSFVGLINPALSKFLVDNIIRNKNHKLLIPMVIIMIAVVIIKNALHLLKVYFMEKSSQHMLYNIRMRIFKNIQYQEMDYFEHISTGDIITRLNGDLEFIRHFVAYTTYCYVEMFFIFIAATVFLFLNNVKLTIAYLCVMPFIVVISYFYSKFIRPFFVRNRACLAKLNTCAQENIEGNRVVKAFSREDYEIDKFSECSKQYMDSQLKATYAFQKVLPIITLFSHLLTPITIIAGGILAINNQITIGELTMFSSMSWALTTPMQNVNTLINDYHKFSASVEKVVEICFDTPIIQNRDDSIKTKNKFKGKVEFKDVVFSSGDKTILNGVSFTANPGETIAIMGPTGSGKTTIANLLSRFYDINDGHIYIDDTDINKLKLEDIHRSIVTATQDVFLFSDTIENNIAFSNVSMSRKSVIHAATLAAADSFIKETPDGYDTIIGERGVGLSGGQRQRLAFARAIAARPSVLILDDTTSAVDAETEAYIQNSLKNLPFKCTKFIIAQRVSSVINADKIVILQDGKATTGNHSELAAKNRFYRDICELQDVENLPDFVGGEE